MREIGGFRGCFITPECSPNWPHAAAAKPGPVSGVSNRARPLDYFDRHGNGEAT